MTHAVSTPSLIAPSPKGRSAALAVVLIATIVIGLVLHFHGWRGGWRLLGVHTQEIPWLDLRVITAAVQTAAEGGNPYVANPHDPAGRTFNYPSAWLWVFAGIGSPASLVFVALGLALAAVGTMLMWLTRCGARAGVFVGLLLVSPSCLLAVERGNTDLLIFALIGGALPALFARRRWLNHLGILGLVLASVLKIYPVVVLVIAVGWGPAPVRRSGQVALVFLAGWFGFHWAETVTAIGNTQVGAVHSYGRKVLAFAIELHHRSHGDVVERAPLEQFFGVLALVVGLGASWLGFKLGRRAPFADPITHREIGWLTGGMIYVLTFLAGSSFSYRLWFLLLALPWLIPLAGQNHPARRWAQTALASLLVLLYASPVWWLPLVWIGQAASWILFAALVGLLSASFTAWAQIAVGPRWARATRPATSAER